MGKKRLKLIIEGRVQGVWFRDSTRRQAVSTGVGGWVKNRADGKVEAVLEGDADSVDRLAQWCRQGPPGAGVTGVHEQEEPWTGEFDSFNIIF
ncbi:MAG: acylphosphatase [Desulfatiglandaceae bacterium]